MTNEPAVSVILPAFNGERYLRQSVESVLSQTFSNFELLIWDDASTDSSWDIVQSHRDSRIVSKRQPRNRGLFPNLNDALREPRGDRIRLWAQDDLMKPNCLEREQLFWERHPEVGMFYCATQRIDEKGALAGGVKIDETPEVVSPGLADEISFNWGSMPGNIANVSIPRRVLQRVGPFDESMLLAADFEMWVRIQGAGLPIGFCREELVSLRAHPGQLSRSRQAHLTFMREEARIRATLDARLPAKLSGARRRYASFLRVLYFNSAVKAWIAGDFGYAREILKELRQWDSLPRLALRWLATANLRLYRPEPVYTKSEDGAGSGDKPR